MNEELAWRNRIEDKIDELTKVTASIARAEEMILGMMRRQDRFEKRLDGQEDDLNIIKEKVNFNSSGVKLAERAFWLLIAAGLSVGTYFLKH